MDDARRGQALPTRRTRRRSRRQALTRRADASRQPAVRQDDDVREHDIEQFIRLEREVWEALANGDGQADGRLLSDDFLGVYTVGFADRAARRPTRRRPHGYRGLSAKHG